MATAPQTVKKVSNVEQGMKFFSLLPDSCYFASGRITEIRLKRSLDVIYIIDFSCAFSHV